MTSGGPPEGILLADYPKVPLAEELITKLVEDTHDYAHVSRWLANWIKINDRLSPWIMRNWSTGILVCSWKVRIVLSSLTENNNSFKTVRVFIYLPLNL